MNLLRGRKVYHYILARSVTAIDMPYLVSTYILAENFDPEVQERGTEEFKGDREPIYHVRSIHRVFNSLN